MRCCTGPRRRHPAPIATTACGSARPFHDPLRVAHALPPQRRPSMAGCRPRLTRVLVATDGSECAQHAAAEAVRLLGADHHHVVPTVSAMPAVAGAAAVTPAAEISLGPDEIEALDEAASEAAHLQVERTGELLRSAGARQVQTT